MSEVAFEAMSLTDCVALAGAMAIGEVYEVCFRLRQTAQEDAGEPTVWKVVVDTIDDDGVWVRKADDPDTGKKKKKRHDVTLYSFPDEELEYARVEEIRARRPCARTVKGKTVARDAPPAPSSAAARGPKRPKNSGRASGTSSESDEPLSGPEGAEEEDEEPLPDSVTVGVLQNPSVWGEYEPEELVAAARERYLTPGQRDYTEVVARDFVEILQLLVRGARPGAVAQVVLDHLEQVRAYRDGLTPPQLEAFRAKVKGHAMASRYRDAWKASRKTTPTATHARPATSSGSPAPAKGKGDLFCGKVGYAKLTPEQRTQLAELRKALRK
jgi:hypothetical protein